MTFKNCIKGVDLMYNGVYIPFGFSLFPMRSFGVKAAASQCLPSQQIIMDSQCWPFVLITRHNIESSLDGNNYKLEKNVFKKWTDHFITDFKTLTSQWKNIDILHFFKV